MRCETALDLVDELERKLGDTQPTGGLGWGTLAETIAVLRRRVRALEDEASHWKHEAELARTHRYTAAELGCHTGSMGE